MRSIFHYLQNIVFQKSNSIRDTSDYNSDSRYVLGTIDIIRSQHRFDWIIPSTRIYQFNIMDNPLFHGVVIKILNM